jgi:hypothetical protein
MIKREHTLSDVSLSHQIRFGVAEANLVLRTSHCWRKEALLCMRGRRAAGEAAAPSALHIYILLCSLQQAMRVAIVLRWRSTDTPVHPVQRRVSIL